MVPCGNQVQFILYQCCGVKGRQFLLTKHVILYVVAFIGAVSSAISAYGSSPAAWAAHKKEVILKCSQVSGLSDANVLGDLVDFDDRVGYTVAIVVGKYPQPYMKGKQGRALCLFDRRTRTAYSQPADRKKE